MLKPCLAVIVSVASVFILSTTETRAETTKFGNKFYMSLGYGPVINKISDFRIEMTGGTKGILAFTGKNLEGKGRNELDSSNFLWSLKHEVPIIHDPQSSGIKGNVGYASGGFRMEAGFGYQQAKLRITGDRAKLRGGGMPVLLVKKLAAAVMNEEVDQHGNVVAPIILRPLLDKVSSSKHRAARDYYVARSSIVQPGVYRHALEDTLETLRKDRNDEERYERRRANGYVGSPVGQRAVDLINMGTLRGRRVQLITRIVRAPAIDKAIYARALAVNVEGAEVIEISSIRNTSATANVCYDFPAVSAAIGLTPYLCGGLGANFIQIVDKHIVTQLSYELKLGVDYQFFENYTVYVGSTYSKMMGTPYYTVPTQRLTDDVSAKGRTRSSATIHVKLEHVSLEVGGRITF